MVSSERRSSSTVYPRIGFPGIQEWGAFGSSTSEA